MKRRIIISVVLLFALAQLVQPDRNTPVFSEQTDLLVLANAPAAIKTLVTGACYDCHSYRTEYPVWAYVTPFNFWIQHHINEGREVVNFSAWDTYAGSEEVAECGETINEGEMPPSSYSMMHAHGRLTAAQRKELAAWFDQVAGKQGADGEAAGDGGAELEHDEDDD